MSTIKLNKPLLTILISLLIVCFHSIAAEENLSASDQVLQPEFSISNYPKAPDGATTHAFTAVVMQNDYLWQGETLLLKVLVPPGVAKVSITAQSNGWQCAPDILDEEGNVIVSTWDRCPRMDGFEAYPGEICQTEPTDSNPSPCGAGDYVYPDVLHTVTARLSDILFPTEVTKKEATEVSYSYFVLYQPKDAQGVFIPTSSYGLDYGISDPVAYNAWLSQRPWAGGSQGNSIDGFLTEPDEPQPDLRYWDHEAMLEINASNFTAPAEDANTHTIYAAVQYADYVRRGEDFILKVLVPPGTSALRISAQSNSWQCAPDILDDDGNVLVSKWDRCPRMDGFDSYPGEICQVRPTVDNPTPCGTGKHVYPDELHTVTARLGDNLYQAELDEVLQQAQYSYFILYQAEQALGSFRLVGAYALTFTIDNTEIYNQWRAARPWAGGIATNSIDGLDEDYFTGSEPEDPEPQPVSPSITSFTYSGELQVAKPINFYFDLVAGDATLNQQEIDFGDGYQQVENGQLHSFTTAGHKVVTLKVTDAAGLSATKTISLNIVEPVQPEPLQIEQVNISNSDNFTISADASVTGGSQQNFLYIWDFGDGNNEQLNTHRVEHSYLNAGSYTVNLTVVVIGYEDETTSTSRIVSITDDSGSDTGSDDSGLDTGSDDSGLDTGSDDAGLDTGSDADDSTQDEAEPSKPKESKSAGSLSIFILFLLPLAWLRKRV